MPSRLGFAMLEAIDEMGNPILVADEDQRCVYVNSAAVNCLLYARTHLLSLHVTDVLPPDGQRQGSLWAEFLESGVRRGTCTVRRGDGSIRACRYNVVPNVVPGLHLVDLHDVSILDQATAELIPTAPPAPGTVATWKPPGRKPWLATPGSKNPG